MFTGIRQFYMSGTLEKTDTQIVITILTMRSYLVYALWTDLKRRSTWALLLSMVVVAVSTCLCVILFSVAKSVHRAVEAEIIQSGAVNSMDVAARPDREFQKPWAAPPIGTDDPTAALRRLLELLDRESGEHLTTWQPSWLSPGWAYLFLTPPSKGGIAVAAGISLTSPNDPEADRIAGERLAGGWVSGEEEAQIVLPKKISDRLWPDVLFDGETAWIGITETSTCVEVRVQGIYRRTQRNHCLGNSPVARAVQSALEAEQSPNEVDSVSGGEDDSTHASGLQYDRVRLYFDDRRALLEARTLIEERYKFWASTPYDDFESKLSLAAATRTSAWVVFAITLGSACGSIFCTFLAWVSRRRYEIALLKAQGSGNAWVAGLYVLQSGTAGLLAGVAGAAAGVQLCPLLAAAVSQKLELKTGLELVVPAEIVLYLVGAAILVSILAALLPARIAVRQDPWKILREAI